MFLVVAFALLLIFRDATYVYIYSGLFFVYIILRTIYSGQGAWRNIGKNVIGCIPLYLWPLALSVVLLVPGIVSVLNSSRGENLIFENPIQISTWTGVLSVFVKSFS